MRASWRRRARHPGPHRVGGRRAEKEPAAAEV